MRHLIEQINEALTPKPRYLIKVTKSSNGYTFRYFIYEHLLPIIDQYNGVYIGNHRSHFKIQENLYDENDTHLDYLIRNAIDQTINELCWKI